VAPSLRTANERDLQRLGQKLAPRFWLQPQAAFCRAFADTAESTALNETCLTGRIDEEKSGAHHWHHDH
jgi:hypothetical protein